MERYEESERLVTPEEREELNRILGAYGLYNASQDIYPTIEHPEDDKWIIRGEK